MSVPSDAERTAHNIALERVTRAMSGRQSSAQIGPVRRYRAGTGSPPEYQPTPNPSTFIVPCRCHRGAHASWTRPCGGWNSTALMLTSSPGRRSAGTSGEIRVASGAEAGEDLPPDRVVPVPERAAADNLVDRERAAAQHLVVGPEEDFRVLLVRIGDKARVRQEVARRPLPDVTDQLPGAGRRGAVRIGAGGRPVPRPLPQGGPGGRAR